MGWHQGHGFALQAKAMAKNKQKKTIKAPMAAPEKEKKKQ